MDSGRPIDCFRASGVLTNDRKGQYSREKGRRVTKSEANECSAAIRDVESQSDTRPECGFKPQEDAEVQGRRWRWPTEH